MIPNPFALPGRSDPFAALDPFAGDASEVLKLYVDVDHTEEAFQQFERAFRAPRELTGRGQLIVAMGESGCGKSALINRCAWHACTLLKNAGLEPLVVDVRDQGRDTENHVQRIEQISKFLIRYLYRKQYLDITQTEYEELIKDPAAVFADLGLYLSGEETVVVVRLPRTELPTEITAWANKTHARLLFFAELRGEHDAAAISEQSRGAEQLPTVALEVKLLGLGHTAAFVRHRMERANHPADGPQLHDDVARRVDTTRGWTIRELQKLLFYFFEERCRTDRGGDIHWQDLLEYFMRDADRLIGRNDG
ncbi:hypothetical protein QLQ12_36045 [Actinoplanes sp. NEAU-A12]|uniref:ATP-binding protein n=1 Tax=Actinoplanes sandaracinus TaxID=3045177 RepID=A0ABT6WWM3_9ACTN|nr:hypothetical protein [Actinoplanes sandaracinus]MDI6104016.1 hypothetical protein [Actinoplanes sandaracinus]